MSGVLLSFSIPEMLPNLIAGLDVAGAYREEGAFEAHSAWARTNFGQDPESAVRLKRQTIREYDPDTSSLRSPYARIKAGYTAHIWWKSRSAQRRKLGSVPITSITHVEIKHSMTANRKEVMLDIDTGGTVQRFCTAFGWKDQNAITLFARRDGFNGLEDFRDYFVPKPGDTFRGVLIEW